MHKRRLCSRPVSARLLDTFTYSMHTAEDVKLLSRDGRPIILFLSTSTGTQYQVEPLQWGAKYKG